MKQRNLEKFIQYILERPNNSILELFKYINCNPNHPEHYGAYIDKRNPNIAMVSNGSGYLHQDASKTINRIYDDNRDRLYDMLESYSDLISEYKQNRHQMLKTDDDHTKDVKKDIRFKLYDMKKIITDILKQTDKPAIV